MVSIYLKSGKLPIRIPIYIAIVALARYLILDMKEMGQWKMLVVGGTALILSLTVLAIRYGHIRFATFWTARFIGSLLLVVETMRLAMTIWSSLLTR